MKLLSFKILTCDACAGMIIPLAAIALIATIAVCGLAVDTSRLFLTQLRLQRSLDAGAVAGAYMFARFPVEYIEQAVRTEVQEALSINNLAFEPNDINIEIDRETFSVDVSATIDVPLYLLQVIPGIPNNKTVFANAVATRPTVMTALVLDLSSSMAGDKLTQIKAAANKFVSQLNPRLDQAALITYSSSASVRIQMNKKNDPIDINKFHAEINDMQAGTSAATCIACGLYSAHQQMLNTEERPGAFKFIVLFTDGIPTNSGPSVLSRCGWQSGHEYGIPVRMLGTLSAANRIKSDGIMIYSVGVGSLPIYCDDPANTPNCQCSTPPNNPWMYETFPGIQNPYDRICDDERNMLTYPPPEPYPLLNPYLLAEIANDPNKVSEMAFDLHEDFELPENCGEYYSDNEDCYCSRRIGNLYPQGVFLHTEDSSNLSQIFEAIFYDAINNIRLVE